MSQSVDKNFENLPHCTFNINVICGEYETNPDRCENCGWNPVVSAERLWNLRHKGKKNG